MQFQPQHVLPKKVSNNMSREVTVWKALLDGECKQIAESESSLWRELKSNAWFEPEQRERWSIVSERCSVPVAIGVPFVAECWLFKLEGGIPDDLSPPTGFKLKIKWRCPTCGEEHFTDADRGDIGSGLWFCEQSADGIVYVQWDAEIANKCVDDYKSSSFRGSSFDRRAPR